MELTIRTTDQEQQNDKLVFERVRCKLSVIARPVRTLVVAIPRLEGKCSEFLHEEWELPRFLVFVDFTHFPL